MSNTDQPACPQLERGQILPAFTLPGADGMPHSPWDYKQRQHLLLLFIHSSNTHAAHGLLNIFSQRYREFREEICAILVVTADPVIVNLQTQEALHLPFALVSDAAGNVISRYTYWDRESNNMVSRAVLADRYNAIQGEWISEQLATLPVITDILETLQYLNRICTP